MAGKKVSRSLRWRSTEHLPHQRVQNPQSIVLELIVEDAVGKEEQPETKSLSDPEASSDIGEVGESMTPEELAEAKALGQRELFCELAGRVIDLIFLTAVALLLGRPDSWLMKWIAGDYPVTFQVALFMVLLLAGNMLISFPFSFYAGHVLQHRYQLSRQSFRKWFWRWGKRNLLEVAFAVVLIPGLYWLIWLCHDWWWLVAAAGFFLLSVILGQLAPVLILPIFYKVKPLDEGERTDEIKERLHRISAGTGIAVEGVFRMEMSAETSKANAMLAGLGKTRRILIGDTLLDHFTVDEIEVIFAHEIGHHVHRHIWKLICFGGLYSLVGFYVCNWMLGLWIELNGAAIDYANFPIYTLPLLLLVITLFSTSLEPLQNALSRHFERQADRYALEQTSFREAYQSAFRKLARQNKDDPSPNRLEVILFHSHPPIAERLALADS